eukprot:987371-Pyramimonas_sp.AAC.1
MELGALTYYCGRVMRTLLDIGYFGYFTDNEHAEVNANMTAALKIFYAESRTPDDMRIPAITVLMVGE